ncbi:hypothetical protein DB346_23215 [Verrucomicrobia bacterium LW23]|nr:hypothetical protein DB346_23215 [Verrucomicrobia bacterium LW23]
MNIRKLLDFFNTNTGKFLVFAFIAGVGGAVYYGYRHQYPAPPPEKAASSEGAKGQGSSAEGSGPTTDNRASVPLNLPSGNKTSTNSPTTGQDGAKAQKPPPVLPITLYDSGPDQTPPLSENFAPYGRLIPCETVVTIDSASIATPIIGFVTEDIWHNGKLIIPAGAEVHGKAQVDRSRERIASDSQWLIVWRTKDQLNGAELPLKGLALDMEKDARTGRWAITDGSAGLRGEIIKSDNLAEIKLFASTFIAAAASGLQDTQQTTNAVTGETQRSPLDSPKNAALQATSAVINKYADQIAESIKRDGFYVRVPAGKQFYLYVTQTIDQNNARLGGSRVRQTPEPAKQGG